MVARRRTGRKVKDEVPLVARFEPLVELDDVLVLEPTQDTQLVHDVLLLALDRLFEHDLDAIREQQA